MIWFFGLLVLDYCIKVLCQCNGSSLLLTATEKPTSFASPGYPSGYSNNVYCEWLLDSGTAGQPIVLYGDDMFLDCSNGDFIQIYDGSTEIHSLLALNLCSTSATVEYISSDRYVLVTFSSDGSNTGQGFQITYISAADTSGTGCVSEYTLTASGSPQYLTSEGFPAEYNPHSACRWRIEASSPLSTLNVTITWSDIETDSVCDYDKLTLYDGMYICENKLITEECTSRTSASATPTVYTTSANYALVIFTSDDSLNRYGFVIEFVENIVLSTTTTTPTTTTAATSATTTTVSSTTSTGSSGVKQNISPDTEKVLDYPLMIASGVGGAALVLCVLAIYHLAKFVKSKKKRKKGMISVRTIAPLPARTMYYPRQQPNSLSFV